MNANLRKICSQQRKGLNEKEIKDLLNEADFINKIYEENKINIENRYLINDKDKKIMSFILKYFTRTLNQFLKYSKKKIICKENKSDKINTINKDSSINLNIFISNFLNICIINHTKLSQYCLTSNSYMFNKILYFAKIFFLNDYINEDGLKLILGLQIFLCVYNKDKKSKKIENVEKIYLVIDFLLQFCSIKYLQLNERKINQINSVIKFILDFLKNKIIINFADLCLLSRKKLFFKLIELCQITSYMETKQIISILVEVYKYKLNIDFVFDDLSELFLYNVEKDSHFDKLKVLIAKNSFLNNIFKKETPLIKGEIIKNGFYFSDFPLNGIQCEPKNKFPNEKDGYSIVISFKLMSQNKNGKFTLFSFKNKETKILSVYIEEGKLKIKMKKDKNDLVLNEGILPNKFYILWIIQTKAKKHKMITYLNETKTIFNNVSSYPEGNYKINFGCDINKDDISIDNFVGIIGTLILFNKCLIKDENDFRNITKLIELKGNYEGIPYNDCKKEWGFVDKDIILTLNLLSNDIKKEEDIELIISSKSFGNDNLIYNSQNIMDNFEGGFFCNYFQNSSTVKNPLKFYFRNKDFLKNNLNFPIYSHNSFFDFLNGHGFLYLQLELYYLIGIISLELENKNSEKEKNNINIFNTSTEEEEDFYTQLTDICTFFFTCADLLNSSICFNFTQIDIFQKELQNFKYTLIDLVTILCKNNCKIKIYFVMLFCLKMKEKKYFEFCSFILNYELHDPNDNQVIKAIFSELMHILKEEDCDNSQIQTFFIKLIEYDKIYVNENIEKNNKNEYSKLMRLLLRKSFDENISECLKEYRKRLKKFKNDFSKNNLFDDDTSNIQEEDYNGSDKPSNKLSIDSTNCNEINNIKNNSSSRKESSSKRGSFESCIINEKNNDKNFHYLILIYKYLKNLYICINDKKNEYIEFFENKDEFSDFFNELFSTIERVYPVQKTYTEKDKKVVIIAEYIKCLCIRFLDDGFFEDNHKIIKEEEDKLKNKGEEIEELDNRSTGNLKKSNNSCKTFIKLKQSYTKGNAKGSFVSGGSTKYLNLKSSNSNNNSKQASFISNFNIANNTIEEVLTAQMEFFDELVLTPYTFRSLFLMLFRNSPNGDKIKLIKGKKEQKFDFIFENDDFLKIRYLLKVILLLIERLNSVDTCFMNKKQLIEYIFTIFSELLKKNLENYLNKDKLQRKKQKSMINSLFINKKSDSYAARFYKAIMTNISSINENKDDLIKIVENEMKYIIKISLFELKDPFYFKILREIFFEKSEMNELVFNLEIFIMENLTSKFVKNEKNNIVEINCKNALILLYQTLFFVNKRNFVLENNLFIKTIFAFISEIIDHSSIIYMKVLFLIEASRGKLLFEIIFEIIFEIYMESLRNPKNDSLQAVFALLKGLFTENKLKSNLGADLKHFSIFKDMYDKEEDFTPFYIMDLISDFNYNEKMKNNVKIEKNIYINKYYFELRKKILKRYKDELKYNLNIFSASILFSIKIILSIKELYEFYSTNKTSLSPTTTFNSESIYTEEKIKDSYDNYSTPSDDIFITELRTQFINLSKNIKRIHKDYYNINPFKSTGYYSKKIYEDYRSFIIDKIDFNNNDYMNKIDELIDKINNYNRDLKFFARVIYNEDGRTRLYNEKNYNQIIKSINLEKEKTIIIDKASKNSNESFGSISDFKSNNKNSSSTSVNFSLKMTEVDYGFDSRKSYNKDKLRRNIYLNFNSHSQTQLFKKPDLLNKITIDYKDNKIIYEQRIKFKKDLIRIYFSSFFNKLLTYDEDFRTIKKVYTLTYNKEIQDIDRYKISYPTRIKNYICNNYDKIFLKRDFDFFTDGYFRYSHKYLFKKNSNKFETLCKNKLLFPNKQLLRQNDCLDKEIFSKNLVDKITIYDCEMITPKGSIFGNIFIFNNCLLFKSELIKDKRKISKKSEKAYEIGTLYVCCSLEYDFLQKEKKIIMEFNNIKEIINRTFSYNWIACEIFLKDGRCFFFNLFNEETLSDFFENLKMHKIPVIKKLNEFFKKEEFCKKWREEKITTYDYLLLLNKYSSRTYNDTNQYLVMPWLFLTKGIKNMRNFDIPISVQNEEAQTNFLTKNELNFQGSESSTHGNHYSTSAYLYFYLMRSNPFTNIMIRFQSNNFDVPDRQYTDIKQTLILCENMSNNRELIPELFSIPEIYINLNVNDFGKQKEGLRVHNISFEPYANNPFQFCYILKDLMNNNIEINEQISKWFDFIFGVNQLGNFSSNKYMSLEEREKNKCLRRFNTYCYGKEFNFKKIYSEARKQSKNYKNLYDNIRTLVNLSNSFGQCPYQLLNEIHPLKNKYNSYSYSQKSNFAQGINIFDEDSFNYRNDVHNLMNYNKNIEDITITKGQNEIIYFTKSSNNNYLYCLLNSGIINIYKFDTKNKKQFILEKEVKPKCQFLSLKKTKSNFPIFQPKFLFCELNENSFIFARTLNRTLIYYNFIENFETSFLLKSYVISIISLKNNEFITGSDNGYLCKWKIIINNKEKKADIEIISIVKSNLNSITSLYYDDRLNIIVSTDINTITIRKEYDFEYLNSFKIKHEKSKYIKDVKISDYNFIYILIYCDDKYIYEIQGYTINGTYFGKYVGLITNFQISRTGKLLVNEEDNKQLIIKVLDPVNFCEVNNKEISTKNVSNSFHFYFERPNIIYYGIKDDESTRIKIIFLNSEEKNIFYMDDDC